MGPLLQEVAVSTLKRKPRADLSERECWLKNPALEFSTPTIWIPNDAQKIGLSDREIKRTKEIYRGMLPMSNAHACFDEEAHLRVHHLDLPQELGVTVQQETRI